jgi:hypothetical protein
MCPVRVLTCQRRGLLLRRADHDPIANRNNRLSLGLVSLAALGVRRACGGANILALVSKTARALSDLKTARLAEIIPPRIVSPALVGFALAE